MTSARLPDPATLRLPDAAWRAVRASTDAAQAFSAAAERGGDTFGASADEHNSFVVSLAALHDSLANPAEPFRYLRSAEGVPVLGIGGIARLEGISAELDAARRRSCAEIRGALRALAPTRLEVPPGGFPWPILLGAAAVVVLGGQFAYAAYKSHTDAVRIVEDGRTARVALQVGTRAAAQRECLEVFVRTGRSPDCPGATVPISQEAQQRTETWADEAARATSRAVTSVVIGTAAVAGLVVLAKALAPRKRYIEV